MSIGSPFDYLEQEREEQEALVPLTQGIYAVIDLDLLPSISAFKWYMGKAYAVRNQVIDGKKRTVFMHHLILPRVPGMYTDHINGNKLDNRRANLRYATSTQNNVNRKSFKPLKGVSTNGRNWRSRIRVNGTSVCLGTFHCKHAAAYAYNIAAKHYHGEFASLNEVTSYHEWLDDLDRGRIAALEQAFSPNHSRTSP